MLIARNEPTAALAFSPACMACPNRSAACALNFKDVAEMFGEKLTIASFSRDGASNTKEAR